MLDEVGEVEEKSKIKLTHEEVRNLVFGLCGIRPCQTDVSAAWRQ